MHRFEYFKPVTMDEALSLLSRYGDKVKVLAGGTDLIVKMREQTITPQYVVDIGCIPSLDYVRFDEKDLRIGAVTTLRNIEQSPQLQPKFRVISEAASQIATVAVRNVATIGGNLCNAAPSADMAPPLIALSATVKLVSTGRERIVLLEDFFTGPGTSVLKTDELLVEIEIPTPPVHTAGTYLKLGGARDLAVVGVAAVITLDSGGEVCTDARLVLGAVAPIPLRAHEAEAILKGKKLNQLIIDKAAQTASGESRPISDVRSSAEYRRKMVVVFTRDAIRRALELAH